MLVLALEVLYTFDYATVLACHGGSEQNTSEYQNCLLPAQFKFSGWLVQWSPLASYI